MGRVVRYGKGMNLQTMFLGQILQINFTLCIFAIFVCMFWGMHAIFGNFPIVGDFFAI